MDGEYIYHLNQPLKMKNRLKLKYLIVSDIHLSSPVSRSDKATEILEKYEPEVLIINGDLIDSEHLTRLKKHDWAFLTQVRKLTKRHRVVVVKGNHDGGILDFLGELLGLDIVSHFDFEIGVKKYHVVHGDRFDNWTSEKPFITEFASSVYYWFQKFGGRKQRIALFLKHHTKKFLRCTDKVKLLSFEYCKKHGFDGLIAGHTHFAEHEVTEGVEYWNSGCFAEAEGKNSYITVDMMGSIQLKYT